MSARPPPLTAPVRRDIFLVDDEVAFTDLMGALLEQGLGVTVRRFHDGPSALAALDAADPGLVISDLVMPGMNGFELLREISQRKPGLPCVLVTGNQLDAATLLGNRTPELVDVLFKPVSWRELATIYEEHALFA